jgi:chromosome segregation ATPase
MSLTDEIYRELMDGLESNLDWRQIIAKYRNSKGPLYNAVALFFTEVGPKIAALNEEKSRREDELDQARQMLDSLDQRKEQVESNVTFLEDKENILKGRVETLEAEIRGKSELAEQMANLERIGFDSERLRQLEEAMKEIGLKYGLKGKEAVDRFFDDLKDYGAVLGAELQLNGLQIQIETKKLEAENWQVKEETLRRKHNSLKEVIEAIGALRENNIKANQIIAWHHVLSRFETVEEFSESLAQYGDITKLLKAGREEAESWELKRTQSQSQVEALDKEKTKIRAAIDAMKVTGFKEMKAMTAETKKQLETLADIEINEIRAVGQEVRAEFSDFSSRLRNLVEKVFAIGQEFERIRQELRKYEGVKDILDSHAHAAGAENELPGQT